MVIVRIITVAIVLGGIWLIRRMDRDIDKVIREMREDKKGWIPVPEILQEDESERNMPGDGEYVLISFSNFDCLNIGRYEEDEEGGAFYPGDEERSYAEYGLFVNAWMPLPAPYRAE